MLTTTDSIFLITVGFMGVSAIFVELLYMIGVIKFKVKMEKVIYEKYATWSFWLTTVLILVFWLTSGPAADQYIKLFFYIYLICWALTVIASLVLAVLSKKKTGTNVIFHSFRGSILKLIILAIIFWLIY